MLLLLLYERRKMVKGAKASTFRKKYFFSGGHNNQKHRCHMAEDHLKIRFQVCHKNIHTKIFFLENTIFVNKKWLVQQRAFSKPLIVQFNVCLGFKFKQTRNIATEIIAFVLMPGFILSECNLNIKYLIIFLKSFDYYFYLEKKQF